MHGARSDLIFSAWTAWRTFSKLFAMALVFQIICRGARTMARFCLRAHLDGWWVVDGCMTDVWVT